MKSLRETFTKKRILETPKYYILLFRSNANVSKAVDFKLQFQLPLTEIRQVLTFASGFFQHLFYNETGNCSNLIFHRKLKFDALQKFTANDKNSDNVCVHKI